MTTEDYGAAAAKRARSQWRSLSWNLGGLSFSTLTICLFSVLRIAGAQAPDEGYQNRLQAAIADVDASRYSAGKAELEAAIALAPRRAEAWTELGLLYGRAGDFNDAEGALRQSLKIDAGQAKAHYLLGLTLTADPLEKLDWTSAIEQFRDAIRLDANESDAMDHLGVGLLATGKTDEAVKTLEHAVELAPAKPNLQLDLGTALEAKGDLDAATDHYRAALKQKPDYCEASAALGKVLFTQDRLDEAENRLRDALRVNPDLQDAHYTLARVLRKEKKTDQAQQEFEQTAALDQRLQDRVHSSQLSNGALAKAAGGDFTGAEADLRKAILLRPDYGVPHYNLGLILADEGHMTAAKQQLVLAISLMPGRVQPIASLAKVQSRESGTESANALPHRNDESTFAMPLVTADTIGSHAEFASRLESEGDWADASGEWLRVLALDPAAEDPRLELSNCFEHMENRARAILEARKVLLVNSRNVQAHIALGKFLLADGSIKEASAEFNQALIVDPASKPAKEALRRLASH